MTKNNNYKGSYSLGSNIGRALKMANKTQQDLADYMGKDKSHISKWVNDVIRPNRENIAQIASFTSRSIEQIMSGNFTHTINKKTPSTSDFTELKSLELENAIGFVRVLLKEAMQTSVSPDKIPSVLASEYDPKLEVLRQRILSLISL